MKLHEHECLNKGIGIVNVSFRVELLSSDNQHFKYPCKGILEVQEVATTGQVINANFHPFRDDEENINGYGSVTYPIFIVY